MSEEHVRETSLVSAESNYYDRALDTAIALTVLGFVLGLLTLVKVVSLDTAGGALADFFVTVLALGVGAVGVVGLFSYLNVVPVTSQRVRGIGLGLLVGLVGLTALAAVLPVTLATLLGLVLVVEAGIVCLAGVASSRGVVDTEPSPSSGLLAGLAFGVVGLLIGAALGGTLLGGSAVAYYGSAVVVGLGLGALTILPREDLGSALPVTVLVGALGLVVATGTIGLGWTWSPGPNIDGDFTGQVVVPLFVLLGSIVASWGAAKARAGYGARGRQYGAYLVIYLNAAMMVAIMVSIVAFVTQKGLAYAFHGFQLGAVTALVALSPAIVLAANWARRPAGAADWHSGARQFVRVVPLAALGSAAGLATLVLVTRDAFAVPFTYTVWVNRQPKVLDTAFELTAEPTVGTLVVVLTGVFCMWYFFRKYGSLRGVGSRFDRATAAERWTGIAMGGMVLLVVVLALAGKQPFGLPVAGTLGLALVALASLAAAGFSLVALGSLLVGEGSLTDRATDCAQLLRVGIFGAMGLLVVTTLLEPAAAANPSVGPVDLVPAVAMLGLVAAAGVAVLTAVAARSAAGDAARILHRETALGLFGVAGFAVVAALHVALTGVPFSLWPLTIGYVGTLSWPMTMQAYIPLGAEPGGILPAVVGTVWLVVGAALFAVPLGVGAAIFLTEYAEQGKSTALVEVATNALWSTPSVVFGLFGAAFLIPRLGGDESLMSGMLVLGFMLLPLVLITSREAIKSVPDEYRDASAALGVSEWETIKSVVLPASLPGVITGVILGVGRIAGETAPLILVMSGTLNQTSALDVLGGFEFVSQPPFVYNEALLQSTAALPTQVWAVIAAGVSGSPSMGWASALVLLLVVLTFYALGITMRTYFRRKLNHE
ncbi:phosphate ABC transporter permease PstA [Halobacteriales archaeon Cl-PHB]